MTTPNLPLLGLRVQATARQYSAHLIEHQCQEQRWCAERNELEFENDIAASAYGWARQQIAAERRAVAG
jgi:hypothetical protein